MSPAGPTPEASLPDPPGDVAEVPSLDPGTARTTFRRLASYLGPYRGIFVLSLLFMVVSAAFDAFSLTLLIPFLRSLFRQGEVLPDGGQNAAERIIDATVGGWIETGTALDTLRNICLVVLAAIFLKNLFLYAARYLGVTIQERIERDMRDEVYASLQDLPLEFFNRTKTGQLIARVLNDTRQTKQIISFALADALRHAVRGLAYLGYMFALSWRLTLVTIVLAPILAVLLGPLIRRLRRGFREVYDLQGDLVNILQETVNGIRLVKAYGAEDYERERFEETSGRFADGLVRTEALAHLAAPLSEVVAAFVAIALLWFGGSLVLGSSAVLAPESFVTFIALAVGLISPVRSLSSFPAKAQSALAAADRFFEVVDAEPEPLGEEGDREPGRDLGEGIRLEGVWFAYEEDQPVLRDVSLEARNGEVVALVGPSGAGKSTLVDLLPRFIDPDRGRITLDGVDLRDYRLDALRSRMGIVSQETVIFHDTVRANIAYGKPERYEEDQVWRAAEAANAAEFIRELPRGMDTPLGDRGVRLSGGQRQRIGIARAVLRDPPLLILDEATSNLDTESERLIQRALDRLLTGRTVFVIAHRLSTVQGADRIVVLEGGRVVETGTHRELYEAGGLYRRLYEMQFRPQDGAPRDEGAGGEGPGGEGPGGEGPGGEDPGGAGPTEETPGAGRYSPSSPSTTSS